MANLGGLTFQQYIERARNSPATQDVWESFEGRVEADANLISAARPQGADLEDRIYAPGSGADFNKKALSQIASSAGLPPNFDWTPYLIK